MRNSLYLMVLGMAAATGTVVGMYSHKERPVRGALWGAAAGALAGAAAAGVFDHMTRDQDIPFYSSSSPLYEDIESV